VSLTVDGSINWIRDEDDRISGDVVSGAVLAGDFLYLGNSNGDLFQLSKADGRIVQTWELDDEIWAPPIVIGSSLFAATMNGTLYGFDLESSAELWPPVRGSGAIPDLMALNDELLFVPSLNSTVRFFNPVIGQQVGNTFGTADWVWSEAAIQGDIAYFGDFSGAIYALNIRSGNLIWEYDAETKVKSTPVIIGDALVVVTEEAVVHFIALSDGTVRNTVPLRDAGTIRANPAVDGSAAYIIGTKGRLFRADPETLSVREVPRPEN
jgi:eukaryotic-like serine/threonine-protein kinase